MRRVRIEPEAEEEPEELTIIDNKWDSIISNTR